MPVLSPVGTVAPPSAMDGTCYVAQTRLMQILKEKHIEYPERLSVEWKSTERNVMLVHAPWLQLSAVLSLLRTVGRADSCSKTTF